MKRILIIFTALFMVVPAFADISDAILDCELMIYAPDYEEFIEEVQMVLERFYGPNYESEEAAISTTTKSYYGVDIFDSDDVQSVGINPDGAFAYVHVSKNSGYLVFETESESDLTAWADEYLLETASLMFSGGYAVLTADEDALSSVDENLIDNDGFSVAAEKLGFGWDAPLVWMKGSYISEAADADGITTYANLPESFSAFTIEIEDEGFSIDFYSGTFSESQRASLRSLSYPDGGSEFEILDFTEGTPILVMRSFLDLGSLYDYFRDVDMLDILGVQALFDVFSDYSVNLESYLFNNSDGRLNLVVENFSVGDGDFLLYGSIGIDDSDTAESLLSFLQTAVVMSPHSLYSFYLFNQPFYQFEDEDERYSIYYGILQDDLVFSTDKETLTNIAVNVYGEHGGALSSQPDFLSDAVEEESPGIFGVIDVQSLLLNFDLTGLNVKQEFLMGLETIEFSILPDKGVSAYGWTAQINLKFYD